MSNPWVEEIKRETKKYFEPNEMKTQQNLICY